MNLYTIGFTKKSAEDFFEILIKNNIKKLIDIRLNNSSQLAGFTKGRDLKYFLDKICKISYEHDLNLAPTKEVLNKYKGGKISWFEYEQEFCELLNQRQVILDLNNKYNRDYNGLCLLCSESEPNHCHRKLVAEFIKRDNPRLNIIHL